MKKLIVLAIVFLSANAAFAQIGKGTIFVGASSNLGFTSADTDGADDNTKHFNLSGKAGYFVIDNLAVGLNLNFDKISEGDVDYSITTLGLFGRYYVNGKVILGLGYNSSKYKDDDYESDGMGSVPVEIGYAAFITDNISIEPTLTYAIGVGDNETNTLGINVGFALYLNRK